MKNIKSFKLQYNPKFSDKGVILCKTDKYNYWMGNDGRIRGQSKTWGNSESRMIDGHPLKIGPSKNPSYKLFIGPVVLFSKDNVSEIVYL